mmetsp:Transcript_67002/g.160552  ORF Transcript_67002/g.160552 Transcript_67002/m.160552 type:complete len:660 (-) Transcript_67002:62-2041(-)
MGFKEAFSSAPADHRRNCLDYDKLKSAKDSHTNAATFSAMVKAELRKVNSYAVQLHKAVFVKMQGLCQEMELMVACQVPSPKMMQAQLEDSTEEMLALESFIRLNYVGFIEAVGADREGMSELYKEPFCTLKMDELLVLLGLAWSRHRAMVSGSAGAKGDTWKPPESFVRNTAKYWVKPEQVMRLKARLLQHLPILIFGVSEKEMQDMLLDEQQSSDGGEPRRLEESQLITSIYFDSEDASCYDDRIHRKEGARLVRFRWYGQNNKEDDKTIYIERKVHHEGWVKASSSKDRFELMQKDIKTFLEGKQPPVKKGAHLFHEVNTLVQERGLIPMIRTRYYRSAFQSATNNKVRISLDTGMMLTNEYQPNRAAASDWCHLELDKVEDKDICRFPYAILEIKLQEITTNPEWLQSIILEIDAMQVEKFSKFQHAMAFLHPARIEVWPHWHKAFKDWREMRRLASRNGQGLHSELESTAEKGNGKGIAPPAPKSAAPPFDDWPDLKVGVGKTGSHKMVRLDNVDPKAHMANERTLLHYGEKAFFVGICVPLLLLSSIEPFQILGAVLGAFAAVYLLWVVQEYCKRKSRILLKLPLGWSRGPVIVFCLLASTILITLTMICYLHFQRFLEPSGTSTPVRSLVELPQRSDSDFSSNPQLRGGQAL